MSSRYTGGVIYNAPGGWSGFFPSNSSLTFGYTSGIALGSTYTIECWINPTSASQGYLFEMAQSNTGGFSYLVFYISSGQVGSAVRPSTSGTEYYSSAGTIIAGVWQHVALVNTAGTAQLYVNGYAVGSTYSMPALSTTPVYCAIGQRANGFSPSGTYYNGYISNLRITTSAVYTGNFTPPTGALSPLANTKLLTCRYPTFVDGSTNAYSLTSSSATVSTANPFPTSALPNPALGVAGNGIYTMTQYTALRTANQWPAYDPYYKNVTLNLHGNAGAVLPFNTDASTNNFQVTQAGNTSPSNLTPFIENGYWSNYFDGSGDYLSIPDNTAFDFGSGNFTIETWVNFTSASREHIVVSQWPGASNRAWVIAADASASSILFAFTTNGTTQINVSASSTFNADAWYHIAVCRDSTNLRIFVNGAVVTTYNISTSTIYNSSASVLIGAFESGSIPLLGYVSNCRIVKGTAVYTSAFTPPTTPLTAISGTSLLTCQSNRFIDNSANAFTVTPVGNAAVNQLQPFTAQTLYSSGYGAYFDGTSDYLTIGASSAFAFGTGDFTVECWINTSTTTSDSFYRRIYMTDGPTGNVSGNFQIALVPTTGYANLWDGTLDLIGTSNVCNGAWNHIAATRSGTTLRLFVNGVQQASTTYSVSVSPNSGSPRPYIGTYDGSQGDYNGYMSNLRVVKGTAVYTSNFTPSTTPLTAISGTSLLTVQTNAPSQNNTFLDSSTNNFVITRNGNTTQGTFTPYGANWSNYFSSNSGLTAPNNSAFKPATNDFTVECWVFQTSSGTEQAIYGDSNAATDGGTFDFNINSTGFLKSDYWTSNTAVTTRTSTLSPTVNQWNHVVLSRTGTTLYLGLNGVLQSFTAPSSYQSPATTYPTVGRLGAYTAGIGFIGYISNFRYVNGTNLYSGSTYTVPTTPLTAITNTSLLTCADNRFMDDSTNAFALTVNGSPSVQRFSPFSPTTAYSTSVIGGSGYFDGTGDYLSVASNDAFRVDQGDWTIEGWVYISTTGSNFTLANRGVYVSVYSFYCGSSGTSLYYEAGTGGWAATGYTSSSGALVAGQWNHIAYVRSSTSLYMYSNGNRVFSQVVASVGANVTAPMWVGQYLGGSAGLNGNMTDFRFVKGTALYTGSTYTVPTAPLTAVSGTSLLLSYTNAAILDNAMMNDLETVGNAQISTSVKKYGTGSIAYDGNGDWLLTKGSPNFNFGGDFTFECWVYIAGNSNAQPTGGGIRPASLMTITNTSGLPTGSFFSISGNSTTTGTGFGVFYYVGGTEYAASCTVSIPQGVWHHIAMCRSGTTVRLFLNGVSQTVTTSGSIGTVNIDNQNYPVYIGAGNFDTAQYGTRVLNGYIDDLRITKGVARYTTSFTPPTSQVQDQ